METKQQYYVLETKTLFNALLVTKTTLLAVQNKIHVESTFTWLHFIECCFNIMVLKGVEKELKEH